MNQYPAFLIIAPLLAACLIASAAWLRRSLCFPIAVLGLGTSFLSSLGVAARVLTDGHFQYRMGGWAPPLGIALEVDYLNAPVLVAVSGAALVSLIATRQIIEREQGPKAPVFYTLMLLAVTGMLGMTATGDAFNLYVLLEISSITGYALTASGDRLAPLASLRYLLLGTIGASFYLLGVGLLYMMTGTLNMADLSHLLPALYGSDAIFAAFLLILCGIWLKAALFPLHAWLPGAYSHASHASACLLAPLMTKVMIYVMLRVMFTVFTPAYVFEQISLEGFVVTLASVAVVAGSLMALAQRNLRRMAVYIVVAEVGYMVGGAWLGNQTAWTGAILHLLNDVLMTLCLFLAIAALAGRMETTDFKNLKGLFSTMPFSMGALVLGAMSIIGVPPACGFFSKWFLLKGAIEAGRFDFLAALLFSSLINVVLFFRLFECALYSGDDHHGPGEHGHIEIHEAPLSLVASLWAAAAGILAVGFYSGSIVNNFIKPALM
ncbi:multisubunit sodium/proton antiporter, MrpD subunit [Desulfatibacillum alkenivorans DSM 16219]|uniref:Multisubunit sodium/proton antiporter, MrpD subunit n=1 Tax=Desulfatibacillum alkenivorans DSM 16219 TaxID=1121393 RepID=A0A1M6QS78_9BACT|nr:proton-conducting transporter membrane subunit [Desulfatibacillum alkenivorans]SHK22968.1 multisubunit sodium/proton antiporter, MrpD subunit [Desulfatibacillum alkenivorans DSM 16219]